MANKAVAVDLGSHSAKILVAQVGKHGVRVLRFAALPRGEREGAIALRQAGVPLAGACVGLAGRDMTLRYSQVPPTPDWQLRNLMDLEIADLDFPIEIVGVPTVRAADGLAMSSRNGYLSPEERAIAPALYAALQQAVAQVQSGPLIDDVECATIQAIDAAGLRAEYVSVRRADDLGDPGRNDQDLVILTAARLGKARLIDNIVFRRD